MHFDILAEVGGVVDPVFKQECQSRDSAQTAWDGAGCPTHIYTYSFSARRRTASMTAPRAAATL